VEGIVARFGGSISFNQDETKISYGVPEPASAELRKFFTAHATVNLPRSYVARIPGGRVFGSGNVLAPDGRLIARDASPDFGKPFEEHWLLTYQKMPPAVPLSGRTGVIATTLGTGYGHWVLEELLRLIALKATDCETLIAHSSASYNREAIALHGFSGKMIEAKRNAHYSCDELIVPSLGFLTPKTVSALEEFTAPLCKTSSAFGERLYVSREKARRRRVANENDLWVSLERRGFVKVHLEDLSWGQQIAAFRAAKTIVAPHGAGLANLVFCQPKTKVIELFNRSYVNGWFWQLATLKALNYCPIVPISPEPLAQRLEANRLNIEADVLQVLKALEM
jgi:Glycosyltransferase 61